MSRKRSFRQFRQSHTILHPGNVAVCDGDEMETFEYYRPGCYYTPQVVDACHTMPYSCILNGMHSTQSPVRWNCCNTATYVVDTYGVAYYVSDLEHQLQLPRSAATSTFEVETTYTYHYDQDECADMDDDEADVSPRKRERFDEVENDGDNDAAEPLVEVGFQNKIKGHKPPAKSSGNVYRSEQGYLVEEPTD